MNKTKILLTLIMLLQGLVGYSQKTESALYLTLTHANVIDVENGKVHPDMTLIIKDDRIESLYAAKRGKVKGQVIDLQHKYVLPGLIDSHVHITNMTGTQAKTGYQYLEYLLMHGITSVRDPAGNGKILRSIQQDVNVDKRKGSDIYFAAFMAGDWYYNRNINLRTEPYMPWEQRLVPGMNLDSAMRQAKSSGATGVKLYHSFDVVFLKKVAAAAKRNKLLVWGHSMLFPAQPVEVAQSGMQVMSHSSMLEYLINDPKLASRKTSQSYKDSVISNIDVTTLAKAMKQNNVILDATLCVSPTKGAFAMVRKLHQKGVKISTGTDEITVLKNPYPHLFKEINYLVNECGFTASEALNAATMIAAETIGQEKNIGSIKSGKKADLLILNGNPLIDINQLKNLNGVIKHGQVIVSPIR